RVVADQVAEQEGEPEARDDRRGRRQPPVVRAEPLHRPGDEEADREDVGEAERARDVAVHLLEGDAEDRRQEEVARDPHRSAAGVCQTISVAGFLYLSPNRSGTTVSTVRARRGSSSRRSAQRWRL